jgi:hypothetical protein
MGHAPPQYRPSDLDLPARNSEALSSVPCDGFWPANQSTTRRDLAIASSFARSLEGGSRRTELDHLAQRDSSLREARIVPDLLLQRRIERHPRMHAKRFRDSVRFVRARAWSSRCPSIPSTTSQSKFQLQEHRRLHTRKIPSGFHLKSLAL